MTLADQIVFDLLKSLGYREPKQFSRWSEMVAIAQRRIDEQMDVMVRVAQREANSEQDEHRR